MWNDYVKICMERGIGRDTETDDDDYEEFDNEIYDEEFEMGGIERDNEEDMDT
ncbi:hypothetical protein H0H92_010147, partial [Tricholoma furcatifolium]